jgi:predicted kinase
MDLIKLITLLLKANPMPLGRLLVQLCRSPIDLLHMPDDALMELVRKALSIGLKPNPRRLILPIGLPGSGKSTFAHNLRKEIIALDNGTRVKICSTDDFFMHDEEYRFNPQKLTENHALNYQTFALAVADGIDVIVIDNTNLRASHREIYIRLARACGYEIETPVIGEFTKEACEVYAARNVHGVPLVGIQRMASSVEV